MVVGGLIVGFAIRYRRKPGDDELPPQIHGNSTIEVVWTVIPTLIVLVLFVLGDRASVAWTPHPPRPSR